MENHHHNHSDSVSGEDPNQYQVTLTTSPQTIKVETPVKLTFTFKENNRNVSLDFTHEMKVHLIVVNEDLTWFHIFIRKNRQTVHMLCRKHFLTAVNIFCLLIINRRKGHQHWTKKRSK